MTPEPMEAVFCQLIGVVFSKAMDRGPRTGVTEGVSLSDLDFVEGGGA
jgi:hypothetical protein